MAADGDETDSLEALAIRSRELGATGRDEEARELKAEAIKRRAAELPEGAQLTPQQIADHFASVAFTGGPPELFEQVGRESFVSLLENGLYPHSTLLDIGCGSLRLGYWLINFLHPGHYFGIDQARGWIEFGLGHVIGPAIAAAKRPTFDYNRDFDLTVFGRQFDFFVARSIWTHIPKAHIRTMLDGFAGCATQEGVFLASYRPAAKGDGYAGNNFVRTPLVEHGLGWIARECSARGLAVRQLPRVVHNQPWLRIERAGPSLSAGLTGAVRRPLRPRARLRAIISAARGLRPY